MGKFFLYIFIISTYGIFFLDEGIIHQLGREDGLIENLGAAFFLIAFCLLLTGYFQYSGSGNSFGKFHKKRNIFYLLLGILLFICFGEEISWGQRLMGWDTPIMLKEINRQNEINVHNLDIFYVGNYTLVFLFTLFSLSYFILIPLANKFSRRANKFFNHIGLPCPPLWIGGLVIINNILLKIIPLIDLGLNFRSISYLYEIKETNYAFCYVVFGISELRNILSGSTIREMKTISSDLPRHSRRVV